MKCARSARIVLQVHAEDGDGPTRRDMRKVGLEIMAYGLWLMAYGVWRMAYGLWRMAYGLWLMAWV